MFLFFVGVWWTTRPLGLILFFIFFGVPVNIKMHGIYTMEIFIHCVHVHVHNNSINFQKTDWVLATEGQLLVMVHLQVAVPLLH